MILPRQILLPMFGITSTNPYTVFSDEELQPVVVNGRRLWAVVGGGMFGWREYRGNLVGFWRQEGRRMIPVAGYQVELSNGALRSLRVTSDIRRK